jgi:hypothetical protein
MQNQKHPSNFYVWFTRFDAYMNYGPQDLIFLSYSNRVYNSTTNSSADQPLNTGLVGVLTSLETDEAALCKLVRNILSNKARLTNVPSSPHFSIDQTRGINLHLADIRGTQWSTQLMIGETWVGYVNFFNSSPNL